MKNDKRLTLSLLGIPLDFNSSFLRGLAGGRARIREAIHCNSTNGSSEDGRDVVPLMRNAGHVPLVGEINWLIAIENSVSNLLQSSTIPLVLGGDHSISYPVIKAFASRYPNLTILHFDAETTRYRQYTAVQYARFADDLVVLVDSHARHSWIVPALKKRLREGGSDGVAR